MVKNTSIHFFGGATTKKNFLPNKHPDPFPIPKKSDPISPMTEAIVVGVEIFAT